MLSSYVENNNLFKTYIRTYHLKDLYTKQKYFTEIVEIKSLG